MVGSKKPSRDVTMVHHALLLLEYRVERLPQSVQLLLQVLDVGVQLGPQLISVWGQVLLDLLGFLGQLALEALGQGDHAPLELLQAQLHLLLDLLGVGHHLGLQLGDALVQMGPQLLALLHQDGLQGLGVHGVSVGDGVLLQLLHLLLEVSDQLLGIGLQAGANGRQIFLQTSLQQLGLLGKLRHEILDSNSIMRVLVVLALFSVCNANVLMQVPPKTDLDLVKDAFWDYVAKATLTAEDSVQQIRQSELGQEVSARVSASADTVNKYVVAMRAQVAPLTQDYMAQFTQEAEQLKARLEKDMTTVSTSLQPIANEMVAQLQRQVEELKKEAATYAEAMDPQALKAVLLQKSQEMREQLDKSAAQLQAQMVPYTEEIKEKMEQSLEEFQRSMVPLTQTFETQVSQKTQEIQQNLAQRGEELRAQLDASAQDLQSQLSVLLEAFTQKTQ
ncbi:hypothetical protein F7725_025516 [Dissostichus mawsoni]|uniref:Apolipoprotein A-IV n=1 Tax=Dissostichus mawsoni TaxID=36200 RepID=A0A7J5XBC8_DISMA|nr:hypothetical protein F7725_025516 [Dissostichus mawsoni]